MRTSLLWNAGLVLAVAMAVPMTVFGKRILAPTDMTVEFGQNSFPQDPAPFSHILDPNDVTIAKGGTVTFEVNGAAHDIAIYPVADDTTRADIDAGLCQPDPVTCSPQGTATSNLEYFVNDGEGHLVIDTGAAPASARAVDPDSYIMYAGGPVFLTGRTAAGTAAQQIVYRFDKVGRYLITCANRNHLINDHMFGFVTVVKKYLD